MSRPDVMGALNQLKGFQRNTVEHAFERLFVAPDSTHRFLVADEVGLGKTLVARGVIAKTIEHLWDSVPRIDILYICSNGSIARQNLKKLQIAGARERSFALATRLTMLAAELAPKDGRPSLASSRLNFVSFTPATSFDMGRSTGMAGERRVLFHLLCSRVGRRTALANLLQGNLKDVDSWRRSLVSECDLEPTIREAFGKAVQAERSLLAELDALLDGPFKRHRKQWPDDLRSRRNHLIGRLRRLLASACVGALEPDLVILDEFQRFKGLLETREDMQDDASQLAQAVFDAITPEGQPVRTLLLSATPYKLYTADAEIEHEDHYADFLATTRFLLGNDESRVSSLQRDLSRFGTALKRAAAGAPIDVTPARDAVQSALSKVMARTERVADSVDQDAMVTEPPVATHVHAADIRQYLAADALFQAVGDRDPMVFWKSAPYLAHFMRAYRYNRHLKDTLESDPKAVADVVRKHASDWLPEETLGSFERLEPAHAKLRALLTELVDEGQWRLLWMPPTTPYWPLEGAYDGQQHQTKALVFSAWNVVPDVLTAVLSYEAERRMMGGSMGRYTEPAKQQSQRLRLTPGQDGRRAAHRNLLTLLPCLTLADEAHPLRAAPGADRRHHVREAVRECLQRLPDPTNVSTDNRWEYLLPLLLDPGLRDFLAEWSQSQRDRPNPDQFGVYVKDLLEVEVTDLGARPPDLEELAVELALGSPAVLAARTLASTGIRDAERRVLAVEIAQAFWSLFNRPSSIKLLDQLDPEPPYWRAVLGYNQRGNLQAVLDETWHLLWEQHAWADDADPLTVATACAKQLAAAITPQVASVQANFLHTTPEGGVTSVPIAIRMSLAQRFGEARTEDNKRVTQDAVRDAFNSPFRPFVLASTSVGQEGLDFHPWCHRLVHWNLPGNPVDLEQREGRVHRFKGHAVRRNVAAGFAHDALVTWRPGDDLWSVLFRLADTAARDKGSSDLVPFWIAPGPYKVIRHVPLLPFTKEVEAFARLKRQLAAYRVVFGQPRQEELLRLLDRSAIDIETLKGWVVDLRPPTTSPGLNRPPFDE